LKPFAPTTDVDVNVTGGSKSVQYYVSLGYQNVDGLYDGTDSKRKTSSNANFQKINYRANIDAQISEIFFTKVSLGGDITDKYRPNTSINNLWKNMHFYPANAYPINTIDGYGGSAVYPKNLKAEILETGFYQEHCRSIQANLTLGQNLDFITKGLKLTETVSLDNRQGQHTLKSKTYQTYSPYLDEEGNLHYSVLGTQDNNFSFSDSGTSRNNIENRFNTEVSLSYNRLFNKHLVSGVLSFHNDKYTIEGTRLPMLTRGFSGQIDYGFDNRIFVDFSFAANGMSIYPSKNNLGFFPAVSLAWVISNEAFMSKHSWIDLLKVRASTGLLGMADYQTAANYYMYQQYYVESNIGPKFGSEANKSVKGLHEYYIANPSASWEKLYRSNIGLDAMFANKTISLNVDAFYDYRYDILTKATLPSYYGMNLDKNINAGKVRNYGVEIALSYTNNIGDFNYSISPNFSFSRNKIKYMAENPKLYDYQYLTGHSIGSKEVLQSTGFYQSIEQITNSPQSTYDKVVPGDLVYTDLNNDGYINDNDYCYDDSYFNDIPEIYYGINVDLEYKGIDFHIDGYGMANRTLDLKNDLNTSFVDGIGNASVTSFNRWAYYPDQGIDTRSTATYPRLSLGANRHNLENSTFWLKSGNMFRISNISLGYTFPRRLSSIINVDKIRLYVSLVNPICFDGIEIGDPEWQSGGYPLMKTYKVGLNINF
jgi:TonB-linked outer membrane protein, SusC/RagA family